MSILPELGAQRQQQILEITQALDPSPSQKVEFGKLRAQIPAMGIGMHQNKGRVEQQCALISTHLDNEVLYAKLLFLSRYFWRLSIKPILLSPEQSNMLLRRSSTLEDQTVYHSVSSLTWRENHGLPPEAVPIRYLPEIVLDPSQSIARSLVLRDNPNAVPPKATDVYGTYHEDERKAAYIITQSEWFACVLAGFYPGITANGLLSFLTQQQITDLTETEKAKRMLAHKQQWERRYIGELMPFSAALPQ